MEHEMKLKSQPFLSIKEGRKDVELRLYDEKRRQIAAGDVVVFRHTETGEKLVRRVRRVRTFKDFSALYAAYGKERMGYGADEPADPRDMEAYYSPEDIARYGCVAIELEAVKQAAADE